MSTTADIMEIEGLDHVLRGGLPAGQLYLVQGDPGVGRTTLALQFLLQGLANDEPALYITFSESRAEVEQVTHSHAWSFEGLAFFGFDELHAAHPSPLRHHTPPDRNNVMIHNPASPGLMMVDDNALVASALERRFTQSPRLRWLGWTDDPQAAVNLVKRREPATLLLDVDMPGYDGFALLRRLVRECPDTAVVMFSGHAAPALIERALEQGAAGYIHKDESMQTITDLLLRAAEGELVLSPLASGSYMLSRDPVA